MKKYLLLLILLLIPTIAFAADPELSVRIQGDSITVKNGDTIVDDYSSYLTYQDGVVTIKEGSYIKLLEYDDMDLTITSDGKVAYIGKITTTNTSRDVHNTIKITNYKNDENTPYRLDVNTSYSKMIIENSTVYDFYECYNNDTSYNRESGVTIKNSNIYSKRSSQIHPGGPIIIENSYIETAMVQSEESHVIVKDSTIKLSGGLYGDGGDGYIDISNSIIEGDDNNSLIASYRNESVSDFSIPDIRIKDSKVDVLFISASANRNVPCEFINSDINIRNSFSYYMANFTDTKFKYARSFSGQTIKMKNSTITGEGYMSLYNGNSSEMIPITLDNSTIDVDDYIYVDNILIANNSNIYSSSYLWLQYDATFNNSYIRIIDDNPNYNSDTLSVFGKLKIHKSYFYLENKKDKYPFRASNEFEYDDGTLFIDKDNKTLYPIYGGSHIFYYDELGHEPTKSVTINYKVKIVFKVTNGTWADGTTDNIVIIKNAYEKLTEEDIPTGMLGDSNGYWDKEIILDNYLTDDVEYNYVFGKVKGVEEIKENPKTGVFKNTFTIIVLLLISFKLYKVYSKKTYYNRY